MSSRTKFALLAASILLVGAGCAPAPKPANTEEATEDKAAATENTTSGTTADVALSTTVELDDSWKTYTDKASTYSFRWPSKGVNAPQWEVKLVPEKDAEGGCVGEGDKRMLSVGDAKFCHTTSTAGDVRTDRYAVKNGTNYAVLTFTKTKPGADYAAHLDQIVSTYKPIAK